MNSSEYNACVRECSDGVYRYALKIMRDQVEAEDIVQHVFEALWVHHKNVEKKKAKAYLFKSAYNAMMDIFRRKKLHLKVVNHYGSENGSYEDNSLITKDLLDHAFEQLPEHFKTVILLRDYEGYSYKEIEDLTGLSESQVKTNIFRGRQFLRNQIRSLDNPAPTISKPAKTSQR